MKYTEIPNLGLQRILFVTYLTIRKGCYTGIIKEPHCSPLSYL